jgi:hypothetical protein
MKFIYSKLRFQQFDDLFNKSICEFIGKYKIKKGKKYVNF